MGFSFERIRDQTVAESGKLVLSPLMRKLHERYEQDGLRAATEFYFEAVNVQPQYLDYDEERRQKLNREAGLIISNHPGYFDIPAILQTIERDDGKIVVDASLYPAFTRHFGERHFIPAATHSPDELRQFTAEVKDEIDGGGVVLLFPTGGQFMRGNDSFKSGFRTVLRDLRPEHMVYSFRVNPDDVRGIIGKLPVAPQTLGLASELFTDGLVNINRLRETGTVRVNERYTQAGEWQDVLARGGSMKYTNEHLTEHYNSLFVYGD